MPARVQKRLRASLREESQKQKALYSKMFSKQLVPDSPPKPAPKDEEMPEWAGTESDTLPPGMQAAPKGSVLLEQI